MSQLDEYDEALEKSEDKALIDSRKMTKEEFITNALVEPGCPPCSSLFVVNDGTGNDEGPRSSPCSLCWPSRLPDFRLRFNARGFVGDGGSSSPDVLRVADGRATD